MVARPHSPRVNGLIAKRVFDLLIASILLVLFSPLLLIVGLIIRRDGGPAMYKGVRVGRGGREFRMMKFRSMVVNADLMGPPSTADDDPRITGIGRMMRGLKIDELPQLINVLRGEMSLVGPRPEIPGEVNLYTDEERQLLAIRPGMTDYSSIVYRNEGDILRGASDPHGAYRQLIRPGKIALGLRYVRTRTLWLDLKILGLTILAIFAHDRAVRRIPIPS